MFSTGAAGIFTVTALGGHAREIVAPGEGIDDIHDAHVLPDGRGILSILHPTDNGRPSVLALHRDGETRVLLDGAGTQRMEYPIYDRHGYILLRMSGLETTPGLWAVPFDLSSETAGEPFLVEQSAAEASLADLHRGLEQYSSRIQHLLDPPRRIRATDPDRSQFARARLPARRLPRRDA